MSLARVAIPAAVALAAAAGILLIEGEGARTAFLVGVCVVALAASRFTTVDDQAPETDSLVSVGAVIVAIVVASVAFEDDQLKLAAIIVLVVVFVLARQAMAARRTG